MADTAKVQLVSSPSNGPSSPPLTPPAHDTSTSSDSFVELSVADDVLSLQELIDSELALRISTDTIEDDPDEEPSVEIKPLEVKKLDLLNLDVEDEVSVPDVRKPDLVEFEETKPPEVDLWNVDFRQDSKNVDLFEREVVDDMPEAIQFDLLGDGVVSNGTSEQHQIDSIDWEPQIVEVSEPVSRDDDSPEVDSMKLQPDTVDSPELLQERAISPPMLQERVHSPPMLQERAISPPMLQERVHSPPMLQEAVTFPNDTADLVDVNTKFILAEQSDQLELTEADIVFFNTFNQVQSNGDDSVSSPDVSVESPKEAIAAMDFDPFATIPVQDLESPDAFPNLVDQNDDSNVPVESSSSSRDDFNNRMDVFTSSNLDNKIILNNLTHPEENSSVNEITAVFPETLDTKERMSIPEIGITPPDPVDYDDDDDECLTEEAGEEFDSWTKVSEVNVDVPESPVPVEYADLPSPSVQVEGVEQSPISVHVMDADLPSPFVHVRDVEPPPTSVHVDDAELASPSVHVREHDVCINAHTSDSESSEAVTSSGSVEKKTSKKKKSEGVNGDAKTKRNKKNKKEEKENISVKSSFSKFDALSKKTVLHVRSGDASKAQKQFSQASAGETSSNCKACSKQVFAMEQVKAERCVWHKNCFRCAECSKQLTVDAYSSHEGVLYCRPHFKELFKPKAVVEDEAPVRRRKPGPIISENQPTELPPEVVRGSDKPDLGLEELSSLNVKSRFQAFEQRNEDSALERSPSAVVNVKRSPSILSKLARFQAKGMDVGVTDDSLNGVPVGDSSSSEEEEEEELEGVEQEVVRANRKHRERPVSFSKMEDIKGRWESGTSHRREERREERKLEISTIRSRLFMGHQGKMKEAYQQAVTESTTGKEAKKEVDVGSDRARSIKERFERGEVINTGDDDEQRKLIEEDLVDAGYTKKSRSLFLELDASAVKLAPVSPPKVTVGRDESFRKPREAMLRQSSQDVVRASDTLDEVQVETADIGNKFKFFETYRPTEREKRAFRITPPRDGCVKAATPEREIYRDPTIVRADDKVPDQEVIRSQTASKMLSFFKQMEETKEEVPLGPKPLKRFTPPPDCELNRDSGSSDEGEESSDAEEDEDEHNPDIIRASDKVEDEFLKSAQTAAVRAKTLRAKFERWEEREVERERNSGILDGLELTAEQAEQSSLDTTKSLRARFESLGSEQQRNGTADKQPRAKVNRFV